MKRIIQILLLLCGSIGVHAQDYTPSESAKISLLTCTPGEAIYSQFGHSALRLQDTVEQIDIVFDYGAFYINDIPRFVWNFLTGKTYYMLDIRSFYQTLWAYRYEGRGIIEQELNLTPEEVKTIGKFLIWNIQPENQEYFEIVEGHKYKISGTVHLDCSLFKSQNSTKSIENNIQIVRIMSYNMIRYIL